MHPTLGRYPVSVAIPVAWGEMDAFQHVNNVVYARWLETARIAYFTRIGFLERMRAEGVGPIVGRIAIDFRRPVTFPDTVRVEATTKKIGRSSFTMGYRIWSEDQRAEVATGEDVIVAFDYRAGRTFPVDGALRTAIAALEETAPTATPART
ncbi:MAG TPA: thioesterase family protein [Anaeromyxobacteraceae bacterium]|nr:thioesterase family protein [Anaeromyxobacteraceae bacterium]